MQRPIFAGCSLTRLPTRITRRARIIRRLITLNEGAGAALSSLAPDNPMVMLKNYFNVGSLWLSNPKKEIGYHVPGTPAGTDNQRGSLQLANSVMETTDQGTIETDKNGRVITKKGQLVTSTEGVVNCFVCHGYNPTIQPVPSLAAN